MIQIDCVQLLFLNNSINESILHAIIIMLSPQTKTFLFNSPKKSTYKQSHIFLAKTSSSNAMRTQHSERQQNEVEHVRGNYSKLLKQKDLKILNLIQRVKAVESQLNFYKNEHGSLTSDLNFFKQKIQEQFYRNICMQSQLQLFNNTLKQSILRIVCLLQGNDRSMQSFAKHLQYLQNDSTEHDHLVISKKLISTLQFQIAQLTESFYLHRKQPEIQKELIRSADLRLQSYKQADQFQKDSLRKHIEQLIDYYQTKAVDSEQHRKELQNLMGQREYIKELLISSEREKNQFANQVYEIARKEYKVDFERMNKSQVVKFCMELLAKLKDLEQDRAQLQEQIRILSTTEKEKYENMLKIGKRR